MDVVNRYPKSIYRRSKSWLNQGLNNTWSVVKKLINIDGNNPELVILDDIFPQMLSAFRIAEYTAYLNTLESSRVYSTGSAFPLVGEFRQFSEVVKEYENRYPLCKGKVFKYSPERVPMSALVYTVFIHNAFNFISVAENSKSDFVFTLYPGGGFRLWQQDTDDKLKRVFSSPSFRKVIVTQKISYDYLIEYELCSPEQIVFVYGGVFPSHSPAIRVKNKRWFQYDKDSLDVCFVAHKYTQYGVDKGYDIFIEVAKVLVKSYDKMNFHVVGPFDSCDIDVSDIEDRVYFYGTRYSDFFVDFYSEMDIILSPNRPFSLAPGSFDGFPTGACIEAGLSGVVVLCTDPLQQNIRFNDGNEIFIIQPNVQEIREKLVHFYHNPEELHRVSLQGQKAFRRVFDLDSQMRPRLRLLTDLLEGEG